MDVFTRITTPSLFEQANHRLTDAVNWQTGWERHWAGGVQYDVNCAQVAATLNPCVSGVADESLTKSVTFERVTRGARAFTVYAEAECSAGGSDWWETGETTVLRALDEAAPDQLERTLWTGLTHDDTDAIVYPNLSRSGPVTDASGRILLQPEQLTITGGPYDVVEGLGLLLELASTCYSGKGVLHVPQSVAPAFVAEHLLRLNGSRLETTEGHRVVIGHGYADNIGPGMSTPAAGTVWVWFTSPMFGARDAGKIIGNPRESLNRANNTVTFIGERTYILAWECCLVGVPIRSGGVVAGSVGGAT